jgi:hypothetical protein
MTKILTDTVAINDLESRDLTPEEESLFEAARDAVSFFKKTFPMWVVIGHAVAAARKRADQIGGGKTFRVILEQQGLSQVVPPSTATRLIYIIEHLPAVQAWHAGLTDDLQLAWASPSSIYQRCPVFDAEKLREKEKKGKNKKSRSPAKATPVASLHNARIIEQQEARIEELEEESHANWITDCKNYLNEEERAEELCWLLLEFDISFSLLERAYKERYYKELPERKKTRQIEDDAVEPLKPGRPREGEGEDGQTATDGGDGVKLNGSAS